MVFERAFNTLSSELDKQRDELVNRQIESETQRLTNSWNEASNLHRLEEEQNDRIGSGFTESETAWYDTEYRKIIADIKDKRIKAAFEKNTGNLKTNFIISAKKQEVNFLKEKELRDTGEDVNYKTGVIASYADVDELDRDFNTNILPQVNNKLDSINDDGMYKGYQGKTDVVFAAYVDQKILLYKDMVNRGVLNEEQYSQKISELQAYVGSEPDFYRNVSNKTFSSIVGGLNGIKAKSSEDFKAIRKEAYGSNLPGVKQQSITLGEELPEEFIQEGINLADPEKKREVELDLRAHNATIPYYRAKRLADVTGAVSEYLKLRDALDAKREGGATGLELQKAEQAFALVQQDYAELNDLVENKFLDFALKDPSVNFTYTMMQKDPRRKGEFVKSVIAVGARNGKDAKDLEFMKDESAGRIAQQLTAEGVDSQTAQDTLIALINEWNVPYESNDGRFNVANNVLAQVVRKAGSKQGRAFEYYDSEYFDIIFNGSKYTLNKEEAEKRGFDAKEMKSLINKVDKEFEGFFTSIQTTDPVGGPDAIDSYRDLAVGIILQAEFAGFKDRKGNLIDNRDEGVKFAKEVLIKSAYEVVNNQGSGKVVRVPKNVFGTDYSAAAPIINDSAFKDSAIDWLKVKYPKLKLEGDLIDQLDLPAEVRQLRGEFNMQKLKDNIFFGTSQDGLGVQMFAYFSGRPEPIIFRDGGPAYIPFEQIINHRAFLTPFKTSTSRTSILPSMRDKMKLLEERKKIRKDLEFENSTFTNLELDKGVDTFNYKQVEDEATALTGQNQEVQSNLDTLDAQIEADNQAIKEILGQ